MDFDRMFDIYHVAVLSMQSVKFYIKIVINTHPFAGRILEHSSRGTWGRRGQTIAKKRISQLNI